MISGCINQWERNIEDTVGKTDQMVTNVTINNHGNMNYANNSQNIQQEIAQSDKNFDYEAMERLLNDFVEFGEKADEITEIVKELLEEVKGHQKPNVIKKGIKKLVEILTGAGGNMCAEFFMAQIKNIAGLLN